jgi:hypothetical protein
MAVRLPTIAPRPEPTPQERNAALLQGVISAIMTPPKDRGRKAETDVDKMIRTMRAQSLIEGLGQPWASMRQSTNIEDLRDRPPVPITLENATTVDDVARVQYEAMARGQPLAADAVSRRMREILRSPVADLLDVPTVTDNPLAAALGYNDMERFRPAPEPYTSDPAELMERMRRRLGGPG